VELFVVNESENIKPGVSIWWGDVDSIWDCKVNLLFESSLLIQTESRCELKFKQSKSRFIDIEKSYS
jgi:hypothetical protein